MVWLNRLHEVNGDKHRRFCPYSNENGSQPFKIMDPVRPLVDMRACYNYHHQIYRRAKGYLNKAMDKIRKVT